LLPRVAQHRLTWQHTFIGLVVSLLAWRHHCIRRLYRFNLTRATSHVQPHTCNLTRAISRAMHACSCKLLVWVREGFRRFCHLLFVSSVLLRVTPPVTLSRDVIGDTTCDHPVTPPVKAPTSWAHVHLFVCHGCGV
jgi:hypothetical protein